MTLDEFSLWFDFHASCFTGLNDWLDKVVKGENSPTRKSIMERWYGVLRNVDLRDAKNASAKIHAGDEPEPKGFDRHPAAIRAIATRNRPLKQYRQRFIDGQELFECPLCEDTGWRFVWFPESIAAAKRGSTDPLDFHHGVAVCTCKHGDPHRRYAETYDPQRDCDYRIESLDDAIERMRNHRLATLPDKPKPDNRAMEFAEFA